MISYDDFREEVRRLRRERWLEILAGEPPGRAVGRRPRDPEQERLLLELDRRRLARLVAAGDRALMREGTGGADGEPPERTP